MASPRGSVVAASFTPFGSSSFFFTSSPSLFFWAPPLLGSCLAAFSAASLSAFWASFLAFFAAFFFSAAMRAVLMSDLPLLLFASRKAERPLWSCCPSFQETRPKERFGSFSGVDRYGNSGDPDPPLSWASCSSAFNRSSSSFAS